MTRCSSLPRRTSAALSVAVILGLVSGCSVADKPSEASSSPTTTASHAPAGTSDGAGEGSEETNRVRRAVESGLQGDPTERALRQALVNAGWADESIETGQNTTPTGLDVDNVDAAISHEGRCLLVDVRPDRTVTVTEAPPMADGRCLIGGVHNE
ncbi:DUF6993 domain-containing protein [Curtobacterium sp. S6]|uniref:DUF6993 domain-containing protein n=1 Tax=Curtobacterium sp. S6 TaxID=1479623 RepID=UPI000690CB3E|nr:hypothetical protein [Curtobacterium sp. S6]